MTKKKSLKELRAERRASKLQCDSPTSQAGSASQSSEVRTQKSKSERPSRTKTETHSKQTQESSKTDKIVKRVAAIAHEHGIYASALRKLPIEIQKQKGVKGPITETMALLADRLNERLTDDLIDKMNSDGRLPKVHFTRI